MRWGQLLRVVGVLVGVVTLLQLATSENIVNFDAVFQSWLDYVGDDIIGPLIAPVEWVFLWAFEWVRSFGIAVPDLQPEWRPVFILTGLVLGAFARHERRVVVAVSAFILILAGTTVAGITGSAGGGLIAAGGAASLTFGIAVHRTLIPGIFRVAAAVSAVAFFAVIGVTGPGLFIDKENVLVLAAVLIAFAAAGRVGQEFENSWREKRPMLNALGFNVSLDILGTMGLALGLAVWFADPPVW